MFNKVNVGFNEVFFFLRQVVIMYACEHQCTKDHSKGQISLIFDASSKSKFQPLN